MGVLLRVALGENNAVTVPGTWDGEAVLDTVTLVVRIAVAETVIVAEIVAHKLLVEDKQFEGVPLTELL